MTDVAAAVPPGDRRARAQPLDRRLVPVPPSPRRDGRRGDLRDHRASRSSSGRGSGTTDPRLHRREGAQRLAVARASDGHRQHRARHLRAGAAGRAGVAGGRRDRDADRALRRHARRRARRLFPPARRRADAADRPLPGAAAAAAAPRRHHALPRHAAGDVRAGDGDLPAHRLHHRHHQLDAHRAHRARRRAGAEGARVRAGGEVDGDAVAADHHCATSCRTCCRRSWSRRRSASPTRSSPRARCRFSASASRRISRPGGGCSSTGRTS